MSNFFRPGFWDILGTALGVIGLLGSGTIAFNIAPSGYLFVGSLVSILLVAFGGYSLRQYLSVRAFPFGDVEHELTLRFTLAGGASPAVTATLQRVSSFSPRAANLTVFDRYQLVPDLAPSSPGVALTAMNHAFDVEVQRGRWFDKSWNTINSVALDPRFGEFRQLRLYFKFAASMKEFAKRIKISEKLALPNDFSSPLEFYEVEITEPARKRSYDFVFDNFRIVDARVIVLHGSKRGPPRRIPVQVVNTIGSRFSYALRDAPIGSRLRFEWDWQGA